MLNTPSLVTVAASATMSAGATDATFNNNVSRPLVIGAGWVLAQVKLIGRSTACNAMLDLRVRTKD
jgi:hypothetical protein